MTKLMVKNNRTYWVQTSPNGVSTFVELDDTSGWLVPRPWWKRIFCRLWPWAKAGKFDFVEDKDICLDDL